jgi:hypothetical protein
MTRGYFDINPDHNQLISWSWVENYPDIDPDHTHNSFPNGKLLPQHTQLTSSIISIATTTQLSSKNVNHCFTTRLTFIQPYSLQLEWTKKEKNTHTCRHMHSTYRTNRKQSTSLIFFPLWGVGDKRERILINCGGHITKFWIISGVVSCWVCFTSSNSLGVRSSQNNHPRLSSHLKGSCCKNSPIIQGNYPPQKALRENPCMQTVSYIQEYPS